MTQYLPPNLLALFAARDPIPFLPPVDKLPYEKKTAGYNGIAAFVNQFEDPADTPPPMKIETRDQRQERKRRAKAELAAYKLEQDIALWNPSKNANATMDPYKTLFVARINYDTSESKLKREFEVYGNIKKLVYVHNPETNKPRGYAFIEYDRERDMHSAYKHADGRKIDGRRVLVDVERGRTVQGWFPRRLGGGLGGTRRGGPDVNVKHSGREEPRNEERHYMERAERPERRRSRERSRSRERRRKSRSRSRDRHRRDRHKRDRSRERDRNRDQDAKGADGMDASAMGGPDMEPSARKERRRSRSRDRDSRRKRSRSKERKRRDHDRGDRDSRRSERDRGDRGDRVDRGDRDERKPLQPPTPPMPEEPSIPDPMIGDMYSNQGYNDGDYNNYNNNNDNNNSMEANNYEGY